MAYGKLFTCSVKDMGDYPNDGKTIKFAICKKCPCDDPNVLKARYGFYWMPVLAPYPELFNGYMQYRKCGMWNQGTFDNWYTPLYIEHILKDNQCRTALNYIRVALIQGYDVVIACFCQDVSMCHRRLVGQQFEKKKFDVIYK